MAVGFSHHPDVAPFNLHPRQSMCPSSKSNAQTRLSLDE